MLGTGPEHGIRGRGAGNGLFPHAQARARGVLSLRSVLFVVRNRQVCIYVVEALLVAIYLPKKDVYMYIRPTLPPEATLFSWGLPS
jgi:hypothetical protein